ncbi:MAG: hypothetical protein PHC69_01185 [Ruminiclostridium sp.]|nr:hypothetical protein [Ruminiclostridium sp.]
MKIHIAKFGCTLVLVLICLLPLLTLTAVGEEYDTRCGVCGQDNPQWLNENTVHYCKKCGALGYPTLISDKNETGTTRPDNADKEGYSSYENEEDGDIPFEVVIGGAAAVVVVATAMAKKKKKSGKTTVQKTPVPPRPSTASKPSNRREKPKEEKPVGYILQLSQDSIVLTDSEKVVIGIRVMRVADNGQTTVASNAEISLQQQKDTRLLLAPNRGMGVLNVRISQNGATQQDMQETIQVIATVPGKTLVAMITVMQKTGWKMVFR